MNVLGKGVWSGLLAVGPMTLGLFEFQRRMPKQIRSPLPPATLTKQILGKAGVDGLASEGWENATMASHLLYSLGAGVVYSFANSIAHPSSPSAAVARGGAFGILVWSLSYLGWIPLFGLRARAANLKPARNAMMIFNHLVWGVALGYAEYELSTRAAEMLDGRRKKKHAE